MFARARAFLNLTPAERAILRLIEVAIIAAIIAGVQATAQYLATHSAASVNWTDVGHTFAIGFATAIGTAISHYYKSQRDPALQTTAQEAAASGAPGPVGLPIQPPPPQGPQPQPGPAPQPVQFVYVGGAEPPPAAPAAQG